MRKNIWAQSTVHGTYKQVSEVETGETLRSPRMEHLRIFRQAGIGGNQSSVIDCSIDFHKGAIYITLKVGIIFSQIQQERTVVEKPWSERFCSFCLQHFPLGFRHEVKEVDKETTSEIAQLSCLTPLGLLIVSWVSASHGGLGQTLDSMKSQSSKLTYQSSELQSLLDCCVVEPEGLPF